MNIFLEKYLLWWKYELEIISYLHKGFFPDVHFGMRARFRRPPRDLRIGSTKNDLDFQWYFFRLSLEGRLRWKGCKRESVLGCKEKRISPNSKCAWRPSFAGSPFPARKFPSERCHLPPSTTHSCEDKFPPFFCRNDVSWPPNDQGGLISLFLQCF